MPEIIVLTEEQARVVYEATDTVTVRRPTGEIAGFLFPCDRTPPSLDPPGPERDEAQ